MIRVSFSLWVAGWACIVASCQTLKPINTYTFPTGRSSLFAIVNHGMSSALNENATVRREFVFPENGIIVVDIPDFSITPQDEFFRDHNGERIAFDPNNQHPDSIKVCGYSTSQNSGYNESYYRSKFGLPPSKEPVEGMKSFDFYFFIVAKDCAADTSNVDSFLPDIYRFLEGGDYKSTLAEP